MRECGTLFCCIFGAVFRAPQTSPVSLFKFNAQDIRVVTLDGAPWFVASDAMKLLYGRTTGHNERYAALSTADVLKGHPSKFGLGMGRHVMLVTEQGLYKLVLESRKPQANRVTIVSESGLYKLVMKSRKQRGPHPSEARHP